MGGTLNDGSSGADGNAPWIFIEEVVDLSPSDLDGIAAAHAFGL